MGEFVYLLPDATVNSGGPLIIGGGGSGLPHDALADYNDSTYVNFDSLADWLKLSFSNPTLEGRKVWGVWVQSRSVGSTPSKVDSYWGAEDVEFGTYFPGILAVSSGTGWDHNRSDIQFQDWLGQEWTEAQLTRLHAYLKMTAKAGAGVSIAQYLIGMYLISEPVVVVLPTTRPSMTPIIRWAYNGAGEAQFSFRVKIFTTAIAEAVGFDAATADTVYDSGERFSSAGSFQIPEGYLTAGTSYYASVLVSKDYNFNGATGHPRFYSQWAPATSFHTGTLPVVEVIAPTGTLDPVLDEQGNPMLTEDGDVITVETGGSGIVTDTTRPMVIWTVDDAENDATDAFEVVLFVTQFPAKHPDDPTDVRALESGIVESNVRYWKPTESLIANGAYTVWVRVRQASDGLWSPWDDHSFSMNVPTPPLPGFVVFPDPENSRIELRYDPDNSGAVVPTHLRISRQLPGEPLEPVRGMDDIHAIETFAEKTYYDHEAPPGTLLTYWASSIRVEANGDVVESAKVGFNVILDTTVVWLKDPIDPFGAMTFPVEDVWLPRKRSKSKAIHQPIGRKKPLVVRGIASSESFGITFVIIGRERYDALLELLETDATLLLQSSKGQWYFEVMSVDIAEHLWDELHGEPEGGAWKVTVQCQEVERP